MKFIISLIITTILLTGCSLMDHQTKQELSGKGLILKAGATLHSTQNSKTSGWITFTPVEGGVHVKAEIKGLTPNGKHGFHIHEFGDVSKSDGMATGGHYNPTTVSHAGPHDAQRHVGDMGNLEANADGIAILDYIDKHMTLNGLNSILGRGVIVHEKADDYVSQPTGNAGGRIAQGVIGVLKAD